MTLGSHGRYIICDRQLKEQFIAARMWPGLEDCPTEISQLNFNSLAQLKDCKPFDSTARNILRCLLGDYFDPASDL